MREEDLKRGDSTSQSLDAVRAARITQESEEHYLEAQAAAEDGNSLERAELL